MRRFIAIASAMLVLGFAQPAGANHPASDWYPEVWLPGDADNVTVCWADHDFDNGNFPGSYGRDRIKDALSVWNQEPASLLFAAGCWDYAMSQSPCQNAWNRNAIFWMNIPDPPGDDTYSDVALCSYIGVSRFVMRFDSENDWYLGTGDVPTGKVDLWGAATHEAGHATGFYPKHWDTDAPAPALCPGNTANHTMCGSFYGKGKYLRDLESHDAYVFNDAY